MLNTTRFANTRLDGFSVLEIQGEGAREFVPLRNTTVTGIVAGPLAELTLVQTFAFTKAAFKGAAVPRRWRCGSGSLGRPPGWIAPVGGERLAVAARHKGLRP